jgi:hypothetical protein
MTYFVKYKIITEDFELPIESYIMRDSKQLTKEDVIEDLKEFEGTNNIEVLEFSILNEEEFLGKLDEGYEELDITESRANNAILFEDEDIEEIDPLPF